MTRHLLIAALLLGFAASGPAQACRMHARLEPADVRYADLVVVGRVANYRIVRDEEFRRKMLASPKLPADLRSIYQSKTSTLMSDYARFDILVDKVLAGRAANKVSATWYNSTFSLPHEMATGPFLIALRRPSSAAPPLRGPSATVVGNREAHSLTLLQAPCSSPFMFESGSREAQAVRRILGARRR